MMNAARKDLRRWAILLLATAEVLRAEFSPAELRAFRAGPARDVAANVREPNEPANWSASVRIPDGYAAWAAAFFFAAELADRRVSGPDAVCAADGLTNLEKYALGLDPHAVARAEDLPENGQLDEHFFLWYRRPSDTNDVEYRVEVSIDYGATWTSAGVTQEPILANELAESWQAHYHAAAGESARLRLVVMLR
ncbi:MAG: hypothetical protein KF715_09105 [Candidatus Didemnitutus sp.]|nr:hypothetical protein [Candidatus Didemnitutus sp.]